MPIPGVLTAVTGIVIPPDTIAGIIAEAAGSATTVAVGWYAWRRRSVQTHDARQGTATRA